MKKVLAILCFTLTLSLAFPVAAASDLPKAHPFYDEINYLINRDVLRGYPDGTMRPDVGVTRAEAVIMIGRLKGFDSKQRATNFSDVPASHQASGYIAAAATAKLINGYPDGTYRPNNTITRAEMTFILSRLFVVPFRAGVSFTDISPNMPVYEPIQQILAANITIGYPDKTFRPNEKVTRGQFSAFLARGLEARFKNDATISQSYLRDKTKSYVYNTEYGTERHVYNYVPTRYGLEMGFVWSIYHDDGSLLTDTLELETHETYTFGLPYSESYMELMYPVKVGQAWYTDTEYSAPRVITKTKVTVKTAYQTFTNAVEVTVAPNPKFQEKGHVYYMVERFGEVKSVDFDGTVTKELIAIE
ncbi:S-layer domain-containing protein [Planococcus donghaensis MPA1U2]|uniref:S-layer domain-containing protein n=1 Tax=Planococcus donghaensis MPA1U2 TaxID=933115 RepID=E7REK3_9BACL|nr:S-layer homology domain-containing protein [Planococcus donghaensis]EGA90584.1 S-layer domain-containing protein [Planococcus donghaensis MPA1U2]